VCFNNVAPKSAKSIGIRILRILSLVHFWCKNLDSSLIYIVDTMLPQDVQSLHLQVRSILMVQEEEMEQALDFLFGTENRLLLTSSN
jgi:hypothetical protein